MEIFFTEDKNLHNYYCVEIGPKGHVLDYQASTYRKFNTDWDCPGLDVATMTSDDGYVVEAKIPRQTLVDLKLSNEEFDAPILTGLFRAEFSFNSNGNVSENWISWVDPRSQEPDFHLPSAFRQIQFPHYAVPGAKHE